jgi:hypothetical protein
MAQLAGDAPPWYHSAARRRLYFLLFPAAVVSYATSGYVLIIIIGLVAQLSHQGPDFNYIKKRNINTSPHHYQDC